MPKKKKPEGPPKIRREWEINPKTRVTPSKKTYKRTEDNKKIRPSDLNWFGD